VIYLPFGYQRQIKLTYLLRNDPTTARQHRTQLTKRGRAGSRNGPKPAVYNYSPVTTTFRCKVAPLRAGSVAAVRREREVDGGGEGSTWRHDVESEQRPSGRGSHHGVRPSPLLRPYRRRLHDEAADGRHATDAVRMCARLHPATARQHQLQTAATLGRPDRQRKTPFKPSTHLKQEGLAVASIARDVVV